MQHSLTTATPFKSQKILFKARAPGSNLIHRRLRTSQLPILDPTSPVTWFTSFLSCPPTPSWAPPLSFARFCDTRISSNIYKRCKHFYSIWSSDFREDEFLSEEYFGLWLALTVLPSKRFARDYRIREGFMLVHEEEKCFSLHKHFLLCSNDKDIPTLETMATYFYCFCLVSWKCENS